jgi:hypothetical protein
VIDTHNIEVLSMICVYVYSISVYMAAACYQYKKKPAAIAVQKVE